MNRAAGGLDRQRIRLREESNHDGHEGHEGDLNGSKVKADSRTDGCC